ncbi:MAG: metalloregulator ArsR/SmtB family transcription factor [Planctomycetota bacterium]
MTSASLVDSSRLLKALGDETRLRILNLLRVDELSGTDLIEILNIGQSRVSAHLALLKEVGLVSDRRVGRRSFYGIVPGDAATIAEPVLDAQSECPEFAADRAGLEVVLERRRVQSRSYFDRVAADFEEEALPGRTWEGLARASLLLQPHRRCVDLGIGDGLLTLLLAERAEVGAVDRDQSMLDAFRARARRKGLDNIETICAEMEDLPLASSDFDLVVFSQALHHAAEPRRALAEARRVLRPGGQVLVIDLLAHAEKWMRDRLGDVHLGFTESALREHVEASGFDDVHVVRAARDPQPPHFMTIAASGTVPTRARTR